MIVDSAHYTYFQACIGRWRCPVDMQITDVSALRRAMGLFNMLGLWLMSVWPPWLGRFYLETTVDMPHSAEVLHTTVVRWLGLPLLSTKERLVLHENGVNFSLSGEGHSLMAPWYRDLMEGQGSIDPSATKGSYRLIWMGSPLIQSTVRDGDQVTLILEGAGFRSLQTLKRIRS